MTKKNMKIISGVLNHTKTSMAKAGFVDGYYYAMDGYRLVRCKENPELLVFGIGEHHPNYSFYIKGYDDFGKYTSIKIPYTVKQIKEWQKYIKKIDKSLKLPFKLGYKGKYWMGINAKFLTDAMETTGSNELFCPNDSGAMIMMGNGFVWAIMGIMLQGFENDKHMTMIGDDTSAV